MHAAGLSMHAGAQRALKFNAHRTQEDLLRVLPSAAPTWRAAHPDVQQLARVGNCCCDKDYIKSRAARTYVQQLVEVGHHAHIDKLGHIVSLALAQLLALNPCGRQHAPARELHVCAGDHHLQRRHVSFRVWNSNIASTHIMPFTAL